MHQIALIYVVLCTYPSLALRPSDAARLGGDGTISDDDPDPLMLHQLQLGGDAEEEVQNATAAAAFFGERATYEDAAAKAHCLRRVQPSRPLHLLRMIWPFAKGHSLEILSVDAQPRNLCAHARGASDGAVGDEGSAVKNGASFAEGDISNHALLETDAHSDDKVYAWASEEHSGDKKGLEPGVKRRKTKPVHWTVKLWKMFQKAQEILYKTRNGVGADAANVAALFLGPHNALLKILYIGFLKEGEDDYPYIPRGVFDNFEEMIDTKPPNNNFFENLFR